MLIAYANKRISQRIKTGKGNGLGKAIKLRERQLECEMEFRLKKERIARETDDGFHCRYLVRASSRWA